MLISQYEARPRIGFWPIGLRDPLPTIPVPLSHRNPPVDLELQQLLHRAYDAADYGKTIYSETPDPPLSKTDAQWARQFIVATDAS